MRVRVFEHRDQLIADHAAYVRSFIAIRAARIREHVDRLLEEGFLWPQPLIQVKPAFGAGRWVDELVASGVLDLGCSKVFRRDKDRDEVKGEGRTPPSPAPGRGDPHRTQGRELRPDDRHRLGQEPRLHRHFVDHVLRFGSGKGVQDIVVCPMNARANSQAREPRTHGAT